MPVSAATERWYGHLLLSLVRASYICGLFRSRIDSALSPRRILIYIAAVDVVVLVSPAGAQISNLPLPRQLVYVAVVCAVTLLLGALSLDIITVLAAASDTVGAVILQPAYLSGRLVVGVTRLTALLITSVGSRRRGP
jgi:hypothetical protein